MRTFQFLRTPIRGDHQSRVLGVALSEAPPVGDPSPADPYPQSLELSFDTVLGVTEVQIAPLWEGTLRFVPESSAGAPSDPAEVTPGNYAGWPVTGDLLLTTVGGTRGFEQAFADLVPLVGSVPSSVRYSRVSLTEDFLFTTLAEAPPEALVFGGEAVNASDPQFHAKLVIAFLAGSAGIPCVQDPGDSSRDTALKPMPAVVLGAEDERSALRVTIASVSERAGDARLVDCSSRAYDDLPGELLVPPDETARTRATIPHTPAIRRSRPGRCSSPRRSRPMRRTTTSACPCGPRSRRRVPTASAYRRVDVRRPRAPGAPVGSGPQRPYPQYRLCWRRDAADTARRCGSRSPATSTSRSPTVRTSCSRSRARSSRTTCSPARTSRSASCRAG